MPLKLHYSQVICDEGYSIEGESRLQCLNTGQFDQPMPQCSEKAPDRELLCGERITFNMLGGSFEDTDFVTLHPTGEPDADPDQIPTVTIFGGTPAKPKEFPWNVLIEFSKGRFCGGSIISREWVLTAGHCLLDNFYQRCNNRLDPGCYTMSKKDVRKVVAGMYDRDSN